MPCRECGSPWCRRLGRCPVPYDDQSLRPLQFLRTGASLCTSRSKPHPYMSLPFSPPIVVRSCGNLPHSPFECAHDTPQTTHNRVYFYAWGGFFTLNERSFELLRAQCELVSPETRSHSHQERRWLYRCHRIDRVGLQIGDRDREFGDG